MPNIKATSNVKAAYRYTYDFHKTQFNHSQCLLTISVGQEVHECEKFEATVDLVSQSFHSCILMIDDTLQRHTMVLDRQKSAEEMYLDSLNEGDRWLARNEKYFFKLSNLSDIIRWDKWLKHPDYLSKQEMIKNVIATDSSYKLIFDETIQEFLNRYYNRLINRTNFDLERGYQLCLDYLIEECTAMTLWPELGCHFEVYPSRRNFAMDATHRRFVLPDWPDLLHPVAIKFKNRKQLKPQQFYFLNEAQNTVS